MTLSAQGVVGTELAQVAQLTAQLVNLLLGYVRFNADYLTCCPQNASPKTIPLPAAVPVVTTYNVLDMDEAGAVQVCRDVYG